MSTAHVGRWIFLLAFNMLAFIPTVVVGQILWEISDS